MSPPSLLRSRILESIGRHRVSAILRCQDGEIAGPAMEAAVRGGFRVIEFTLNTPGALQRIRDFAADPRLIVGAGTVLAADQVDAAVAAGARFIVSPIVDESVLRRAQEHDVVAMPGTFTPTEMSRAVAAGADLVKLFPAPANIAAHVAQVLGPLPDLRIVPTSGITEDNFQEVLAAGAFAVGFVASLFQTQEMARHDLSAIEARARRIVQGLAP